MGAKYVLEINLKDAMKRKNISAMELSKLSGISKSEIYHICRNEKNPTLYTMLVLAKALGLHVSELYELKEK